MHSLSRCVSRVVDTKTFYCIERGVAWSGYARAYFSVYNYTKCVLLEAGRATLKTKMCNIKLLR